MATAQSLPVLTPPLPHPHGLRGQAGPLVLARSSAYCHLASPGKLALPQGLGGLGSWEKGQGAPLVPGILKR